MKDQNKIQEILRIRIEDLCRERGLTYYTLSYQSSIPLTTLLHVMDGTTKNPGIYTIIKICDGLGITLQEFFATKEFEEAIIEARDDK